MVLHGRAVSREVWTPLTVLPLLNILASYTIYRVINRGLYKVIIIFFLYLNIL